MLPKVIFQAFLLLIIVMSGFAQSASPNKYALVIGISKYNDMNFDSLEFADKDANDFYEFLQKGYMPGIKPENIKKLINDSARFSIVDDLISNWLMGLRMNIKGGDHIYIYWSGHGVITGSDQSLLCRDTKYSDDSYTGSGLLAYDISIGKIKNAISWFAAKTGVKVFLIVDACRTRLKGLNSIPSEVLEITQTPSGEGDIYFYSCSTDGPSFETNLLIPGSGVFTYFLLLGLEGGADRHPVNGEVTVGEIELFIKDYVTSYVKSVLMKDFQTPYIVLKNNPDRNVVITKISPKSVADRNRKKADSILYIINNASNNLAINPDASRSKGIRNSFISSSPYMPFNASNNFNSGIGDIVFNYSLPQSDSSEVIYDSLLATISRNELVVPKNLSAFDYYLKLKKSNRDSLYIDNARRKLVIALVDKVKDFIETYLDGKLPSTKKEVFDLAYEELSRSIELRLKDDPFTSEFIPRLRFLKARALAGSNKPTDWMEGLNIIDSALGKYKTAYMYHTKGMLYSNKGRYFTARRYFDTAVLYAPNWIYALYNRAIESARLQEFEESINNCEEIIRKNPNFSRAYSLLGYNYEILNNYKNIDNYEKAISCNKKALSLDSANASAYLNLGRLYSRILVNRLDNLDSAAKYYRMGATRLSDENCLTMLGKMCFDGNPRRLDSAEYYYKKSWAINPFNTTTLRNFVELLRFVGNESKADSIFLNALDGPSLDYKILSGYRAFSFVNKSPDFADSIYHVIINSNHEDPNIFLDHSKQYEGIDSIVKAKNILEEGMRFITQSPSLNYALGTLFFKNCQNSVLGTSALDSALFYYKAVYELAPKYSLVNFGLSKLYSLKDQRDSANFYSSKARELNKYVQKADNITSALLSLGNKELSEKKYFEAINYFRQVYSLDEDRYNSRLKLARSYYLLGYLDSARKYYYEALQHFEKPANIIDSVTLEKDELRALIEFDDKKINNALFLFGEMDKIKSNPDYVGQVICLYKLNGNKSVKQIAELGNISLSAMYNAMKNKVGTTYSVNFINELTKAYNFLTDNQNQLQNFKLNSKKGF